MQQNLKSFLFHQKVPPEFDSQCRIEFYLKKFIH